LEIVLRRFVDGKKTKAKWCKLCGVLVTGDWSEHRKSDVHMKALHKRLENGEISTEWKGQRFSQ